MTQHDEPRPAGTPEAGQVKQTLPHRSKQNTLMRWLRAPREQLAKKAKRQRLSTYVWTVVSAVGLVAMAVILRAFKLRAKVDTDWPLELSVFVAVAAVPQWIIDPVASLAEKLSPDLPLGISKRGFLNLGAFVGMIERPLYLGSLIAGYPEFIAAWLVFKGIAGYRLGLDREQRKERRLFQLFLLNNAMSLGAAALGWLVWQLLGLPTGAK